MAEFGAGHTFSRKHGISASYLADGETVKMRDSQRASLSLSLSLSGTVIMLVPRFFASRNACALLCGVAMTTSASTASAQIVDNFESYALGSLPSPTWLDAGAVLPTGRIPSFPSATVISTLDAFGNSTQAVATVGDLATSKGIYANVPVSTFYLLRADVRVDRYSDAPASTSEDWAMQLTVGRNGVENWAYTP